MSIVLIDNIDNCSFILDGEIVLFARTPIGIIDAAHCEVKVQGSLMDAVGLPEDIVPSRPKSQQRRAIQSFLRRVDLLRGQVVGAIDWLERNPVSPAPHLDDLWQAERKAQQTTVNNHRFLLRKAAQQPATAIAERDDSTNPYATYYTILGADKLSMVVHVDTIAFIHLGTTVYDGVNGASVGVDTSLDKFLDGIGIKPRRGNAKFLSPELAKQCEEFASLVAANQVKTTKEQAGSVEPAAPVKAPMSTAEAWAYFATVPRPSGMVVSSSEEADTIAATIQDILTTNPDLPGFVKSKARTWIKEWKGVSRRYATEFGINTAPKQVPAAVLARKATKRENDRAIRTKMQK